MKEFLSYMKSTLLAAGQLCSARRALHCSKSFALLTTVSLALAVLCTACADNDSPFRSVIPDEDDDYIFAIKPLPIEGEEIPYGDSRALNPMSVDKENMIKKIAIFQYDAENNLRQLKDGSGYFIYVDFTNADNPDNTTSTFTPADKGYTRVTEKELPPLSTALWTSTASSLKTCVIANVPRSMVESALFPNGKNNLPADWAGFQKTSFDLPFLTEEEVENDKLVSGELELGHLSDIYMFGYFEGTVPYTGFTLGLGRTVARLKVTFSVEDTKKIDPDAKFYAAVANLGIQSSYFIKMDANTAPNISKAYLLDPERFDLSTGEAVIQFYGGPKVNENINDRSEATTLLLWYVRPNDDGNYSTPDPTNDEWLGKAVKVPFGNAPKEGNYGIVRNTLYSFRLPLIFNSTGFGIEYMYSSTLRAKEASPLPWSSQSWHSLILNNEHDNGFTESGEGWHNTYLKINWDTDVEENDMIKFYYTREGDSGSTSQAVFKTSGDWNNPIPGTEYYPLTENPGTFEIILNKATLDLIKDNNGLVVQGENFIVTMIEIWKEGYTSAAPVAGDFTFAIVDNSNNEWDWEHRGYMEGTTEHPYALSLGATNSKGSDFLISNLLNTSSSADRVAKYGVVDYVIYKDATANEGQKTFKLVDKPYAKRQVQFDFSQLTYDVKTGTNEISPDYIKIVPIDTDGDNNNDSYALLPLQPTTALSSGQEVIFYVTIDEDYPVGKKEGNKPEYFTVTSRTVPVKVTIADAFSHILKPNKELQVASTGQSLDDILAQATSYTAEKKYYGEIVKTTNVTLDQLTRQTTDTYITAVNKNGTTVSDLTNFRVNDGKLEFPDDFIGTIYLHYDVASTVTEGDLVNYHYSDLLLPIKVDVIINYTDLESPYFPIKNVNFGTSGWDSNYDKDSQTITFSPKGNGSGRGWWFDGKDLSNYAAIQIDFENLNPSDTELQIIVEYTSGANTSSISSSEGPLTCEIDGERPVKQIYIIASKTSTVKLTRVALGTTGGSSSNDPTPTSGYKLAMFQLPDPVAWVAYGNAWAQEDNPLALNLSTQMGYVNNSLVLYDLLACSWKANMFEYLLVDDSDKTNVKSFSLKEENKGYNHDTHDSHIKFTFASDISFAKGTDETRIIVGDDGTIYPLENCTSSNPAKLNVNLKSTYAPTESNASGITISSRTVPVDIIIEGSFTHELTAANEVPITNGLSTDNLIKDLGALTATKKYDGVNINAVSNLTRYNDYTFGENDVQCTGTGISFQNWQFSVQDGATGSVTLTLHIASGTNDYPTHADLKTYKYPSTMTLIIPVSSGTPTPTGYPMDNEWDNTNGNYYYTIASTDTNIQKLQVESVITANISDVSEGAEGVFKIMCSTWQVLDQPISLSTTSTSFSYTLRTEDEVTALKENGLAVGGIRYTLQNVTFSNLASGGTTGSIWSGTFTPENDNDWLELNKTLFNGVNENDQIVVALTVNGTGQGKIIFNVFRTDWGNSWGAMAPDVNNYNLPNETTSYTVTLTSNQVNQINERGLKIGGSSITITSVSINPGT